jgi:hypothetical protein
MSPGASGTGGAQPLANLVVQFQLEGQKALQDGLAALKASFEAFASVPRNSARIWASHLLRGTPAALAWPP